MAGLALSAYPSAAARALSFSASVSKNRRTKSSQTGHPCFLSSSPALQDTASIVFPSMFAITCPVGYKYNEFMTGNAAKLIGGL